jgi:hypothetical protein
MPVMPGIHSIANLLVKGEEEWAEPMYLKPPPRYLFRGQPARFDHILPSINRFDPWDEVAFSQHYTICRWAKNGHIGRLKSYEHPSLLDDDAVAILQHYGMRTPFIDLTSDLYVALYFAMFDTKPGEECHLYLIDWKKLPSTYRIISHEFVFGNEGATNRWVRQKGYAIAPRDWHDARTVRDWDLLNSPAYQALDRYTFKSDPKFSQPTTDVMSKDGDPLPSLLHSVLSDFVGQWDSVHKDVMDRIEGIP